MTENLNDAWLPKLRGALLFRREGPGFLVFDGRADIVFQTNLVGREILCYCDGSHSISEISKLVADTFKAKEQVAREDVKAFFFELAEFNLIEYV